MARGRRRRGGGRPPMRPRPPGGRHRRRHHRHRHGPQFIPYAVGVPVPVYDEVDHDDSEAVLDAFLALMDSETDEDAALMGMEQFGGSKWKKKYSAAKKKRKAAEEKLASCKEAAEEKANSSEEEASSDEPVSEPTMENGEEPASEPEPSSAPQEEARPPEEPRPPVESVVETAEESEESPAPEDDLAELWAEAAEEDAADDDFGILVQNTTSMLRGRPTQVLDVFAASLSSLPEFRNSTPMQRGGLTDPGDYDHQVYPKGFPVQYHEDLEGHLSETDELVDSIRNSFGNSDW